MRKIIVSLVVFVAAAVSVVALAKDGPFPMMAAAGIWHSDNAPGMTVEIKVGRQLSENTVAVSVIIRDAKGVVVARGVGVHVLSNSTLNVELVDRQGRKLEASLVKSDQGGKFHLVMNLHALNVGGETRIQGYILSR